MNNEILCLILNELNAKELLRLERVSQQFKQCVNYALKRINGLVIGHHRYGGEPVRHRQYRGQESLQDQCLNKRQALIFGNISEAIDGNYDYFIYLNESRETFESIATKCSNIKSLYLSNCLIDYKTVQSIVNRCPQLQCLSLDSIFCPSDAEDWEQISTELSKLDLIHLTINGIELLRSNSPKLMTKLNYLVQCLSSLQTLIVCNYNNSKLFELFEYLPQSLRCLHLIGCQSLNIDSINTLIGGKGKYLNELKVICNAQGISQSSRIQQLDEEEIEIFSINSENLFLRKLYLISHMKPNNRININNLKALEDLTINTMIEINSVFNRLKYLSLNNCGFSPKTLNKLVQNIPNLSKLLLININFICDCNLSKTSNAPNVCQDSRSQNVFGSLRGQSLKFTISATLAPVPQWTGRSQDRSVCDECIAKCMNSLSELPKLKHFCIVCPNMEEVLDNCLNLIELNYLDLKCVTHFDKHVVKRFVRFCRHAFDNRVSDHSFTIILNNQIYQSLVNSLSNVVIPKQFKFNSCPYYYRPYY